MSDAKGEKNDPTVGEPIEERAVEVPGVPEATDAPADERPSALADALGEDPDGPVSNVSAADSVPVARTADASSEPVAADAADRDVDPARDADRASERSADEPTSSAAAAAVPAAPAARDQQDAGDELAPADEPKAERKPEPDYAALAAELDELEARHGAAATVTPAAAPATEPAAKRDPWFERADETETFKATEPEPAPSVTPSEPVPETTPAPKAQSQPVFVEAPEPPRKRGNRAAAGAIGILAAIVFAILYFAATVAMRALRGEASFENLADVSLELATSVTFWIPVVAFFLAFWLLGAIVNRASWIAWVLLGLFVGVIAYAGHVFAPVLAGPFWMLTQSEALGMVEENLLAPLAIAAFVIGREVTVWFGGWAAKRGAKMTRLNAEAQAEYEKTLEAGPDA